MRVRFVLVCEGPSDAGLVPQLQAVCVQCGASEAVGNSPDFSVLPRRIGPGLQSRVEAAVALDPSANLIFVHRDADARTEDARVTEIGIGCENVTVRFVPIVPIQETEAWLLVDEVAIRAVVENPRGRANLYLPRPAHIERLANPKEKLREVLALASEATGRRLEKIRRDFSQHRRKLLQRLDISGPVSTLPAWDRLVTRTRAAIEEMQA